MAILAGDFDRGPHLAVQLAVAVNVLDEVAVDAMHPFFEVDVEQVNRHVLTERLELALLLVDERPRCGVFSIPIAIALKLLHIFRHRHGRLKLPVGGLGDRIVVMVEERAAAIFLEHGAKNPSVTVEVGELRVL